MITVVDFTLMSEMFCSSIICLVLYIHPFLPSCTSAQIKNIFRPGEVAIFCIRVITGEEKKMFLASRLFIYELENKLLRTYIDRMENK